MAARVSSTAASALAAELIAARPKAIVVSTMAAAEAAREHSGTIPIVMTGLNDPVGAGLAVSLASPGGNITGMATMNDEVMVKLLGLLRSVLPAVVAAAVVVPPTVLAGAVAKVGAVAVVDGATTTVAWEKHVRRRMPCVMGLRSRLAKTRNMNRWSRH